MCTSFEVTYDPFVMKFSVADLYDKVKDDVISVYSLVCFIWYCNPGTMLCSAELLFFSCARYRMIQFCCVTLNQGYSTGGTAVTIRTFQVLKLDLKLQDKQQLVKSRIAMKSMSLFPNSVD